MVDKNSGLGRHCRGFSPHSSLTKAPLAHHKKHRWRRLMALRDSTPQPRPEPVDLDARYGRIGISAVAAALHYPNESRNPNARVEPAKAPLFPIEVDA